MKYKIPLIRSTSYCQNKLVFVSQRNEESDVCFEQCPP